jgi:hypothetical protein
MILKLLVAAAIVIPLSARAAETPGPVIELAADGVQIYTCAATAGGFGWTLKAPDATLRDASGHVAGRHFAGPAWQATDGSKVVGTPVTVSRSPNRGAIGWLVIRATEHDGAGLFADVTYITRTRTMGGVAPGTGCDASHRDAETRVLYSATYTFFTTATP